jgi:uncharacterized membrane protein
MLLAPIVDLLWLFKSNRTYRSFSVSKCRVSKLTSKKYTVLMSVKWC